MSFLNLSFIFMFSKLLIIFLLQRQVAMHRSSAHESTLHARHVGNTLLSKVNSEERPPHF